MVSQEVLLEFKKAQKNKGIFPEKVPLVDGYIYKKLLVIKKCPLCSCSHGHGPIVSSKYPVGYLTIRVRHCACRDDFGSEYIIRIAGKMTKREYDRISKQEDKSPHLNDSVNFMDSSEYFAICDERKSWV